jgi:hypothetical protein
MLETAPDINIKTLKKSLVHARNKRLFCPKFAPYFVAILYFKQGASGYMLALTRNRPGEKYKFNFICQFTIIWVPRIVGTVNRVRLVTIAAFYILMFVYTTAKLRAKS